MRANADILEQDENEQDKLSDKQWTAISCLLDGKTLQATADTCGINARTLRRWLHSPDFSEEYTRARRQHLDNVAANLQSAANDAAETLMRLLKCGDPLIELRAAKTILQISQKSVENAEIQKRLDDLESTNAQQAVQIRKLESENYSLNRSSSEFATLKHELKIGTFTRPDWISKSAWDSMVRVEAQRSRSS